MTGIDQSLTLAFARMPASAIQGCVAEAAVGLAVLASAVGRADSKQEPVPQASAEVSIRDGFASCVLRCWEEEGAGTSATIALEVASVVFSEECQDLVPLLFGCLLGEQALHFGNSVFHGGEPVDRSSVAGSSLNSHGTGLLELGGNCRAFGGEGGPGMDAASVENAELLFTTCPSPASL